MSGLVLYYCRPCQGLSRPVHYELGKRVVYLEGTVLEWRAGGAGAAVQEQEQEGEEHAQDGHQAGREDEEAFVVAWRLVRGHRLNVPEEPQGGQADVGHGGPPAEHDPHLRLEPLAPAEGVDREGEVGEDGEKEEGRVAEDVPDAAL